MTIREHYFSAMRRQGSEYIPFEFDLCDSLKKRFKELTGEENYWDYYGFPDRGIWLPFKLDASRFAQYFPDKTKLYIDPIFGFGQRHGDFEHFWHMEPSLHLAEDISDFEQYPYPSADDFDWSVLPEQVENCIRNDKISTVGMEMTIFETAWYTRGMETFLMDMLAEPELAEYHLDRITDIRVEMTRRCAQAGVDKIRLGDDVATQLDMMIAPEVWREMLKPRLAKVIKAAKDVKPDILIHYHGDGNMYTILNDLIEIGVDILNPIQPECMDPFEIKKEFGDRVSFCGCVGTQTTMPFGTADEVRELCEKLIAEVGEGGGLFIAPSHLLEPEVPWENIMAFVDTVKAHNDRVLN